jgi:hypothetical protein
VQVTAGARSSGQGLDAAFYLAGVAEVPPADQWLARRPYLFRIAAHLGDGSSDDRSQLALGYSHATFADGTERKWAVPNITTMRLFFDAARLTGDNMRFAKVDYNPDWVPGQDENKRFHRCTNIQSSRAWPGTRMAITPFSPFIFSNSLSGLLALFGFTVSTTGGAVASRVPPQIFTNWVLNGADLEDLRVLGFGLVLTDGCVRMSCQREFRSVFRTHAPHANVVDFGVDPANGALLLPDGERGAVHYIDFTNTCVELVQLLHAICDRLGLPVCAVHVHRAATLKLVNGRWCNTVESYRVVCIDRHRPLLGSVLWPQLLF